MIIKIFISKCLKPFKAGSKYIKLVENTYAIHAQQQTLYLPVTGLFANFKISYELRKHREII